MNVVCPSCGQKYEIPEEALTSGPARCTCSNCSSLFDVFTGGLGLLTNPAQASPPPPRPAHSRAADAESSRLEERPLASGEPATVAQSECHELPSQVSGEVRLAPGTYDVSEEVVITASGVLTLSSGTSIRFGRGVGITAFGRLLVLGTEDALVKLQGDGWSGIAFWGGDAAGSLIQCAEFVGAAGKDSEVAGGTPERWGGALIIRSVPDPGVNVLHCRFSDCNGRVGGAIYASESAISIEDCSFDGNRADQGGGLFISRASRFLRCEGSTFRSNVASRSGGAIYADQSGCAIIRCVFEDNRATPERADASFSFGDGGGAIAFRDCGVKTLETNFVGNISSGVGGALFGWSGARLDADACAFMGNVAKSRGGAIYGDETDGRVVRSKFERNEGDEGGAAFTCYDPRLEFDGCEFEQNEPDDLDQRDDKV